MKVPRLLASLSMALTLVTSLVPVTSTFADSSVPSWGNPSRTYGAYYNQLRGDLTDSGLGNPDSRPAILDRWQAVFTNQVTQQVTMLDKYDVYDIQKQADTDNFATKSGYGLLPQWNTDAISQFVKDYANGNPQYVLDQVSQWSDPSKDDGLYLLDGVPYVRMSKLVELSGGGFDRMEATPTQPYDPGRINGTAYFRVSPWPRITTAAVQGDTIHVAFTTYGLNSGHHPVAHISNGIDSITKDFGQSSQPIFNGTWDIPVSDVTSRLGPVDKLSVIVEDGFGRTATAPLKPGAVLTYHWGTDYHVSYTPGQPAVFTQSLVLTLDQMPSTIDPKTKSDTFQWSYSVDGGAWKPLNVIPDIAKVFDQSGNPKQKIVITTDTLNQITPRSWGGGSHTIRVQVTASPGDQGQYLFSSQDSGTNQPSATVTVTFDATHPLGQQAPGQAQFGPLVLKWGQDLPNQVPEAGYFTAPVEISNNGDLPVTTTLDFTVDGTVVIERVFEGDGDTCKAPPPDFMNFPLKGTIEKTFTVAPHSVVRWNVRDGISYIADGYKGPSAGGAGCISWQDYVIGGFMPVPDGDGESQSSSVTAPLSVGHSPFDYIDDKTHEVHFHPNYAAYIKVTPKDPQDYLSPYIDAWVGVKGMSIPPGRPRVHLVQ